MKADKALGLALVVVLGGLLNRYVIRPFWPMSSSSGS